jgi:hypothetical protein
MKEGSEKEGEQEGKMEEEAGKENKVDMERIRKRMKGRRLHTTITSTTSHIIAMLSVWFKPPC